METREPLRVLEQPVPNAAPKVLGIPAAIERAMQGDRQAWAQVYAAFYPDVFRQLRYLTGDKHTAQELAQETFAQAMVSRDRYDPARPLSGWLCGIALNVARKRFRKQQGGARARQRLEALAPTTTAGDSNAEQRTLDRQRSAALYAALDELPENWREAFVLKELQELTAPEVARLLGTTAGNVAVRVTRARQRIREILVRHGLLEEPHSHA